MRNPISLLLAAVLILHLPLHASTRLPPSHPSTTIRHPTLASYRIHAIVNSHTHADNINALPLAINTSTRPTVFTFLLHLLQGFFNRITG